MKIISVLVIVLTIGVCVAEQWGGSDTSTVTRNDYGDEQRKEVYEVNFGGETEQIEVEVHAKEYTTQEVQEIFRKVEKKLDEVILGENESFDYVTQELNLVTYLDEYPVEIHWDLSSYQILGTDGKILKEDLDEDGTLVELRGTVVCQEETMVYIRNVRIYPPIRAGAEKVVYEIQKKVEEIETSTRSKDTFSLPEKVGNSKLTWEKKQSPRWPYVLGAGSVFIVFLFYREREKKKKQEFSRKQLFLREYPNVVSKFTMLLGTGATVKHAWEKIVENYEEQKESLGRHLVYEEMKVTLHEMQRGISEAESYERFGKRCGVVAYLKFGTLLSQNLRKGSKGLSDLLRMEAIQAFEKRKSEARRLGEEVGAKLLLPMMGMLVVVMVMVMVPAFLTMQI